MSDGLQPLLGGMSGETFLSDAGGSRVVVRIYSGRSLARGPEAPQVDAAVLAWVRGVVPVAQVLEVRRGDPDSDRPGLLVTSFLPGRLLSDLLPSLDATARATVGAHLGLLLGRLAHVALPRAGVFTGSDLAVEPMPRQWTDLTETVGHFAPRLAEQGWSSAALERLVDVATAAQVRLDTVERVCLVHGDLNPKNVLVDPVSLEVTGLLDWEFAHAGSPYSDLGNLLRHERDPGFADAVVSAREAFVPDPRSDTLELARCADVAALVDLAARAGPESGPANPHADHAAQQLRAIVAAGDVSATP